MILEIKNSYVNQLFFINVLGRRIIIKILHIVLLNMRYFFNLINSLRNPKRLNWESLNSIAKESKILNTNQPNYIVKTEIKSNSLNIDFNFVLNTEGNISYSNQTI